MQARSFDNSSAAPQRRAAQQIVSAIRRALATGNHLEARRLAREGGRNNPDDRKLQMISRLLSPPVVEQSPQPVDPGMAADRIWLRKHSEQYRGHWVALRKGKLLATAPTASQLRKQLVDFQQVLMTRVV